MSIIANDILIPTNGDFIKYNGTNITKVIANDVVVWEREEDKVILPDRYYIWDGQTLDDGINPQYNNTNIINGTGIIASCSSFINGYGKRSGSNSGIKIINNNDLKEIISAYNKIYFSARVSGISSDSKNFTHKTSLYINSVSKVSVIKSVYNLNVGDNFTYYLDISGISESIYKEGDVSIVFSINNTFGSTDKKTYSIGLLLDEISLIDPKDTL